MMVGSFEYGGFDGVLSFRRTRLGSKRKKNKIIFLVEILVLVWQATEIRC